ncbi:MAG: hypothetical protein J6Y26_05700 [Lachnospiraceae bacterium]|nr:hypothetical protein [Lachnospiraceae bacterium]
MRNRRQMALACLEIERAGMSVLDFLQDLGAVSPWGTWWRLQVEELGRERHQIRDGKGVNDMKKLTLENKKKAVEIALGGGNYLDYLKKCGAGNPSASWTYIKKCLQAKDPEKYEQLMAVKKQEKPAEPAEDPLKDFEPVVFQGKEYEKAEKAEQKEPKTEQKAEKTSGKRRKADQKQPFKIREAEGAVGIWTNKGTEIKFWKHGSEISLTPVDWLALAAELPNVLKLFGMEGGAAS